MNSDGGVAESLNVMMDEQEMAPVLTPKVVKTAETGRFIYIHKGNYFELTRLGVLYIDNLRINLDFSSSEIYRSCTSIGNTIIITTNQKMYYILYKDGTYKLLGSRIPELAPTFSCTYTDVTPCAISVESDWIYSLYQAVLERSTNVEADAFLASLEDAYWGRFAYTESVAKQYGFFLTPVFARYAIKLYDGSYIYQSVPILLGAKKTNSIFQKVGAKAYTNKLWGIGSHDGMEQYKAEFTLGHWDIADWKDIVKSVDVFISTDIEFPATRSKIVGVEDDGETVIFDGMAEGIEKVVESKSNFYLIKSISADEIEKHGDSYTFELKPMSQDELVTKQTLSYDYRSTDEILLTGDLYAYNQRLISGGYGVRLSRGCPTICAPVYSERRNKYLFKYYVNENGVTKTVVRWMEGVNDTLSAWIAYPNLNCQKVEIWSDASGSWKHVTVPMEPHPRLSLSYAFWGLGVDVFSKYEADSHAPEDADYQEDREVSYADQVIMSSTSNPFLYPASGRQTFSARVLGVAAATLDIATEKFGQYPLYAFTADGIYAISLTADGSFGTVTPLSRDVAVEGTVTPIDQAIVFTTAKGVMMVQSSNVVCISPNMAGKNPELDEQALTFIGQKTSALIKDSILNDNFLAFIQGAKCAYDYKGSRLIFLNPDSHNQYVYKLDTQTWHKMAFAMKTLYSEFRGLLNSYPECIVSIENEDGSNMAVDLDTIYAPGDTRQPLPIVIVSRTMDLDEPDVLKTINHLKIRGRYERYKNGKPSVSYMLYGSQDGLHFQRLGSLRGKSWKLFKIVVLAELDQNERISWIDIDYETRFTNKLR